MPKRIKKLKSSIDSYKLEIEKHFQKLEKDIEEKNEILAGYHVKEIDKSLINALQNKIRLIGDNPTDKILVENYKKRLEEFKEKLGIE
ncbi:hypothetical protein COU57_00025 [Candidatus Pacearchaeota archaeon CG10_big_fil_rev_8_21_14_0_10_32_14]|nr:MAG: hypothetical protein COU57_00025 [Candidatus Pacearchaeota archaeon CG10_big_fil_rev_8_21_14_0_10_32_14]